MTVSSSEPSSQAISAQDSSQPTAQPSNGTSTSNDKDSSTSGGAGYFEEDNGNRSSMRLMSFFALMSAIGFGIATFYTGYTGVKDFKCEKVPSVSTDGTKTEKTEKLACPESSETSSENSARMLITFGFLLAAFAPKAVQKFAEEKLPAIRS